jgi:hypothetical protein
LDDVGTYTNEQAEAALAAATLGDLPPITGQALNFFRVNTGESGVEFRTPAQLLTDVGAASASDLTTGLALKAPLEDAILTGVVTAPTPTAGNDSDIVATTAFVQDAIAVDFTGTDTSITLGTAGNTFAHGLGAVPKVLDVVLVCTTNEDGFVVGQEIDVSTYAQTSVYGSTVARDDTNVIVYFGPSGIFLHGPSGYLALNLASFSLVVRARL